MQTDEAKRDYHKAAGMDVFVQWIRLGVVQLFIGLFRKNRNCREPEQSGHYGNHRCRFGVQPEKSGGEFEPPQLLAGQAGKKNEARLRRLREEEIKMELTDIICAVITLLAAIMTATVVPWLKEKLSVQERNELFKWVEIAVMAAQQLYHNLDGNMRKEYVVRFLESKGYDVDTQEVDNAIEAAVLKLHQQLEESA